MWGFCILLCAALFTESESQGSKVDYVELMHGHQLSIKMPTTLTDSLEFTSVDETQQYTLWPRAGFGKRGTVSGVGESRHFTISSVNFDDEGTYTQRNLWQKVTRVTKVKVLPKKYNKNCVAGETLSISLDGINKNDASLSFSNNDTKLMLVRKGSPVGNLPDYIDRITVTSSYIKVLNVNVSDVGNYTLFDGKNRKVLTAIMSLVDHHEGIDASPLMALLLLLGIPVGVCCCCRKRIFKQRSQTPVVTSDQPGILLAPAGPPPAYKNPMAPGGPSPMYGPGYPAPGQSLVHPPPNPAYPQQPQYGGQPAMPPNPGPGFPPASGLPPAQPPQWTGPYNQPAPAMYSPGYPGPAPGESLVHPPPPDPAYPPQPQYGGTPAMPPNPSFTPVMYSAPAGSEVGNVGDIKTSETSPHAPLLGPSQVGPPLPSYTGTDVLNQSGSAVQFNIDAGKNSTHNFL